MNCSICDLIVCKQILLIDATRETSNFVHVCFRLFLIVVLGLQLADESALRSLVEYSALVLFHLHEHSLCFVMFIIHVPC